MFKKENTNLFLKLFWRIDQDGILPNLCYKASISLITKPDKDIARRKNFRTMSLTNIGAKTTKNS